MKQLNQLKKKYKGEAPKEYWTDKKLFVRDVMKKYKQIIKKYCATSKAVRAKFSCEWPSPYNPKKAKAVKTEKKNANTFFVYTKGVVNETTMYKFECTLKNGKWCVIKRWYVPSTGKPIAVPM